MQKQITFLLYLISIIGMTFSCFACEDEKNDGRQNAPLSSSPGEEQFNHEEGERERLQSVPRSPKQESHQHLHASIYYAKPLELEGAREILELLADQYAEKECPKDTPFLTRPDYNLTVVELSSLPSNFKGKELVIVSSTLDILTQGQKICNVVFQIKGSPTRYSFKLKVKNTAMSLPSGLRREPAQNKSIELFTLVSLEERRRQEIERNKEEKEIKEIKGKKTPLSPSNTKRKLKKERKTHKKEKKRERSRSSSGNKRAAWWGGKKGSSSNNSKERKEINSANEEETTASRITRATTSPPPVSSSLLSPGKGSSSPLSERKIWGRSQSVGNLDELLKEAGIPKAILDKEASSPDLSRKKEETTNQRLPQIPPVSPFSQVSPSPVKEILPTLPAFPEGKALRRSRSVGHLDKHNMNFQEILSKWKKSSTLAPLSSEDRTSRVVQKTSSPIPRVTKPSFKDEPSSKSMDNTKNSSSLGRSPAQRKNTPVSSAPSLPFSKKHESSKVLPQISHSPIVKKTVTPKSFGSSPRMGRGPSGIPAGEKSSSTTVIQQRGRQVSPVFVTSKKKTNSRFTQTNSPLNEKVRQNLGSTSTAETSQSTLGTVKERAKAWTQMN